MIDSNLAGNDFLNRLTIITEANLSNELFGVSELARELGRSRSYVHKRLKVLTNQSVSQFIRTVRLEKAMKMLRNDEVSAAEVAYNVGFSSPTYFSRCFHDHYGYPPGEVKKRLLKNVPDENEISEESTDESEHSLNKIKKSTNKREKIPRNKVLLISAFGAIVIILTFFIYHVFISDGFSTLPLSNQDKRLSIVVLPFKNLSDNPNNQYFADGLMEDILNNLYWITSLRVISRTSAEQFRESSLSSSEIARQMNVDYVLEGSVRQYNEETRINVQLIDAYQDDHLWSSNFDRELNEIIGIQDEIALQVASQVKVVLSENEIMRIEKIPTQNAKAYDYYLQARFLLHKADSDQRSDFDKEAAMASIQYYEKAIEEDENFAAAYAGLANAWFNISAWGGFPKKEGFPKARELSKKALVIDPECAEARAILGFVLVWGKRNFVEGGQELKNSIHLNPNFATSRQGYAQYLMITGPIEEARAQINYALELEPYFWIIQNLNSWIYYFEEKYDKALEACELAYDFRPNYSDNLWLFVLNYAKLGEGEKMKQQLQKIAKYYSGTDKYADDISEAYNQSGINGLFAWLIELNKNTPIEVEGMNGHPLYIAWWNAIIGNTEEAIYWLEKNMQEKQKLYHYFNLIATNPDFDILRNDPRFLKIIDDIGLSPYHKRIAK